MLLGARKLSLVWRLRSALLLGATAVATANWLDYGLWPEQPHGGQTLMRVALVGCVVLAVACLVTAFQSTYGLVIALVGEGLSWPYFGALAVNLPWPKLMRL